MLSAVVRAWRSSLQLRTIGLFVACGVIPVLLVGAASYHQTHQVLVSEIVRSHRGLAQQASYDLLTELAVHRHQLSALGRRLDIQRLEPARSGNALREFTAQQPVFRSIALHDAAGALVAWAGGGDRPPDRPAAVLAAGAAAHGLAPALDAQGGLTLTAVVPVRAFEEPKRITGYVVAGLLVNSGFQRLIEGWRYVDGTVLYVLATDGSVLATTAGGPERTLRRIVLPALANVDAKGDPLIGRIRLLNSEQLVAATRLPELSIDVVVTRPYAGIREPLDDLLGSIGLYSIVGIGLAVLLGSWFAGGLSSAILTLTNSIHRVAHGELAHRTAADDPSELGRAAAAFNDLAESLHKVRLLEETWRMRRTRNRPPES